MMILMMMVTAADMEKTMMERSICMRPAAALVAIRSHFGRENTYDIVLNCD
jgi:hypothetical protein